MLSAIKETGSDATRALGLAAWATVALLALAAAWTLGGLFWTILALRDEPPAPATFGSTAAPEVTRGNGTVDLAALHLFGQAGLAERPTVVEAPETRLALTLLGTAAAEDPTAGLAIVADDGGQQGYYRAGDALPGNALLEEIHPDRIVLSRQGTLETLRLVREDAVTGASGGVRTTATRPRRTTARQPGQAPGIDWRAAQAQTRLDPKKLLELGSQIRALPVRENGQAVGVRLVASRDAAMIRRLGLRSTDVIQSVNGIPLTDPSRQFELMKLLQDQSTFQVQLRRNGSPMTLSIDARRLQTEAN